MWPTTYFHPDSEVLQPSFRLGEQEKKAIPLHFSEHRSSKRHFTLLGASFIQTALYTSRSIVHPNGTVHFSEHRSSKRHFTLLGASFIQTALYTSRSIVHPNGTVHFSEHRSFKRHFTLLGTSFIQTALAKNGHSLERGQLMDTD